MSTVRYPSSETVISARSVPDDIPSSPVSVLKQINPMADRALS